jgi:hypothetical protein
MTADPKSRIPGVGSLTTIARWSLALYALAMASSLFLGELTLFVWPQYFMLLLRLESWLSFIVSLFLGATACVGTAELLGRIGTLQNARGLTAMLLGALSMALGLGSLLFLAFSVAGSQGWPTSP